MLMKSKSVQKLDNIRKRINKANETILIDDKPAERAIDDLYEQKLVSESIQRTNVAK